jgi:uncharacterized membrane protein YvlD (DUF360 family)
MKKLLSHMVSAGLGIFLATIFIQGVRVTIFSDSNFFGFPITATWQLFILFGLILGLLNFFVKPILDVITLPLRILTLGLFTFVINMALVFALDIIFGELSIGLYLPLVYTTLIIWGLNLLLSIFTKEK